MRFIPVIALLFGSWLLALPAVATEAQDWLRRLAEAERSQGFQGTFVYERNGSFSTHSVWRRVEGAGVVRERLLQLDGPAQEVLRVDGRAQCVSGSLVDQAADHQEWPARELNTLRLLDSYDPRVIGKSRVAGRAAVVLALSPRDQHRYSVELHLDQESALPLKSLLLNDKGQLLERFQFTRLEVGAVPSEEALQPSASCRPVRVAKATAEVVEAWRSDWLPPGFTLSSVTERRSPASSEQVACLVYDDGLARFSVFIEPLRGVMVEDARSQLGPTAVVSRRLATADGDVMVTVVGEVPLGTAERVALSMRAIAVQAKQ
ncbi:MucB/RseB C-terminal domain-containing protein [Pseudomonas sp. sp1636]|uniref:MucB/RseB C-terminal domain-containing protein n=1 Tax=Pseudomonas sp. sp1636 TaxID=3036707 RepID=UPI0025A5BB05|nr:MucB/RseB C-terminal domain-containing protein [Pseudomonas sp. sp1636]MDM8350437.1 MucB/RseB C-terminal domain-containing protein [Pseudomonas sp. sp1636]